jgi:hypothetical protein
VQIHLRLSPFPSFLTNISVYCRFQRFCTWWGLFSGDVVRRLYAIHHGILDSRNIGGRIGTLNGNFSPKYLLQSNNPNEAKTNDGSIDYNITLGYTSVASSLLDLGVDPNSQSNQARLGKVTDRKQQRSLFKSNPLHLASLCGNQYLVKKLLQNDRCHCVHAPLILTWGSNYLLGLRANDGMKRQLLQQVATMTKMVLSVVTYQR